MARPGYYRSRLRKTIGLSAAPYGYTLATWTTGAVVSHAQGMPDTLAALFFMTGAVLGFAVVGVLAFGGVTMHAGADGDESPIIWESFHFFSVGAAIAAAFLVSHYVTGLIAWPLASFCATVSYLLVAGAESAAAYGWEHRKEG